MSARTAGPGEPRRSAWIPWVFVGAMGLVIVVNAVLVIAAMTTFSGMDVAHPYEAGRSYDAVLAEAERQDALGWKAELTEGDRMLAITVRDRNGHAVQGTLTGLLRRPAERGDVLLEPLPIAPGRWIAPIEARRGQWDVRLALEGSNGQRLDIQKRILLP